MNKEPPATPSNSPADPSCDNQPVVYEIQVRGCLSAHWFTWFEGLTIENLPGGQAVLRGPLADQAALHGLLNRLGALNLPILSLCIVERNENENPCHPG